MSTSPPACDLLVIGGGIAGGTCALRAADLGLEVVAVVKAGDATRTNTGWAQGGIVAEGDEDPAPLLAKDILEAGDQIGWEPAVELLAETGPDLVHELLVDRLSVPFDRDADGKLSLGEEAAHSRRRILHVGDRTGDAIQVALTKALKEHPRIRLVTRSVAVDLITTSHHDPDPQANYHKPRVLGAYVMSEETGEVHRYFAHATLLATGGLGQIFLHTTNPTASTGDGIAMAYRAGVPIRNLEYVQFHPTAFFSPAGERFLISEAVRGEGAQLTNSRGERFMARYRPDLLELAPRDEVARAIHEELSATGHPCVYLNLADHAPAGLDIPKRFPQIHGFLAGRGIDMTRESIPVVPAAHYACGGVLVDLDGRAHNVDGLFAAGEVTCTGLHGANRLASTSLLEGLVWGTRAGDAAAREKEGVDEAAIAATRERIPPWKDDGLDADADPLLVRQDWNSIRHTMWNYAGIVRTSRRLQRAVADLEYLQKRIEKFYRTTRLTKELVELRNGVLTARVVALAALKNRTSYGCHYLKD